MSISREQPNHAVQLTPLARLVGWAQFTRQNAPACWRPHNAQPSVYRANLTRPAPQGSAARALPGSCLLPASSTLQTPASGAADSCPLGCLSWLYQCELNIPQTFIAYVL